MLRLLTILALLLPAVHAEEPPRKLETLLLLPEPRALRNENSATPAGSQSTVFSPARESTTRPGGVETYAPEDFQRLGISVETFIKRAETAADKRLAALKPDVIRDDKGRALYAVYRGESELFASLLVAPSLPKVFEPMFGGEIWAALPDRHALYLFPANSPALEEFSADLAERFHSDPFAASGEIFSLKAGQAPRVIGSFSGDEE